MTDKEMAENWVKENCDDSLSSFRGQELQEAFLAGLKAGRTEWHEIADGDLMKYTLTRPDYFVEPIRCAACKHPIYLTEREIKLRRLYAAVDWTKCLCPSCTDEWRMKVKQEPK